eukprot:CAMPEP_0201165022 /NCGR_PEP_ID=MMETSP0851-20130426/61746_1 /ASSEMBLY_ACC=CAM_ASM_000631 /TAXON_ID=183588 /ORGANISM="Pseudo-nitzschia fraudulenta, Strain WWA7" /LENGTH=368 /DNA_ID=CAMNT_0047445563 /DNA_START=102 /DNA_END=1212 /DNA_ORIENTATION=+
MKIAAKILFVLGILQLGLSSAMAIEEDEHSTVDQKKPSAWYEDGEIDQERKLAESASDREGDTNRELAPLGGYPGRPVQPGQTRRYGLNSLLGFRPYTNPYSNTIANVQRGVPAPIANIQRGVPAPKSAKGVKSAKAPKDGAYSRPAPNNIYRYPPQKKAPPPQKYPKNGKNGKKGHKNGKNAKKKGKGNDPPPRKNPDGTYVIGVPYNPNSLASALGYHRIDPGTPIVYIEDAYEKSYFNRTAVPTVPPPTLPPVPTISPRPTTPAPTPLPSVQPSRKPTRQPTLTPTSKPSRTPTLAPTGKPSREPTKNPTGTPTTQPSLNPTRSPTRRPTTNPTINPTPVPTPAPTASPTITPTLPPTAQPTAIS